jgi:hypothetical protein
MGLKSSRIVIKLRTWLFRQVVRGVASETTMLKSAITNYKDQSCREDKKSSNRKNYN